MRKSKKQYARINATIKTNSRVRNRRRPGNGQGFTAENKVNPCGCQEARRCQCRAGTTTGGGQPAAPLTLLENELHRLYYEYKFDVGRDKLHWLMQQKQQKTVAAGRGFPYFSHRLIQAG
jgi:hypothetical protein